MPASFLCPLCGRENPPDAIQCSWCNAALFLAGDSGISTHNVEPGDHPDLSLDGLALEPVSIPPDHVVLADPARARQLIAPVQPRMMLGRAVADYDPPTFDLTDLDALEMGVSREHATILFEGRHFKLIDLDSANGTWLNEAQLAPYRPAPLYHRDQIRLGRLQLIFYSDLAPGQDSEPQLPAEPVTLQLQDQRQALDPAFLAETIGPCLEALAQLQALVARIQSAGPPTVRILNITGEPPVRITLQGASQAIWLLETSMQSTAYYSRRAHRETLPDAAQSPSSKAIAPSSEDPMIDRALALLDHVSPNLPQTERAACTVLLLPILQRLAYWPFTVEPAE